MTLDGAARPPAQNPEPTEARLALVVPTLREAGNFPAILHRVRAALDPVPISYEILVVDDDSRDGLAAIVSSAAQTDPRIRLLVRKGATGLAGAILHGWQHTGAEILGAIDADLQHPPELLPALLHSILDGRDLAIASRYAGGGKLGTWRPARRLASAAAIWATRPLQRGRFRVNDPLSGFFLVRRECLRGIGFQRAGFKLLLEILVRGRIRSLEEIPFTFSPRRAGRSKANLKIAADYATLLARLYRERFSPRRPSSTLTTDH